jgi:ribosomal protein S18 acetylase RimI-like enzyme
MHRGLVEIMEEDEKLVILYPEDGVAMLSSSFVSDPNLRCTDEAVACMHAYQGTIPDYRRKGIGFHLLCESTRVLKDQGYAKLIAEQILPQSRGEISLLEKAGFKLIHSQINMGIRLR